MLAAGCRVVRFATSDVDADRRTAPPAAVARVTPVRAAPPTQPPTAPAARELFILSDSVIDGASYAIPDALPGWRVVMDGKPSRMIDAGVAQLRARQSELGTVVLVQLGNNYLGDEVAFAEALDELYALVGPDRWLILVHVYPIQANRAEVNGAIDALAAAHPNVRVADWPAVQDANPGSTYADQLHLNMRGAELMAGFVRDVVGGVAVRAPPR